MTDHTSAPQPLGPTREALQEAAREVLKDFGWSSGDMYSPNTTMKLMVKLALKALNREVGTHAPQTQKTVRHADDCPWDKTRITLHRRCTCGAVDLAENPAPQPLPQDVINLVIAVREALEYTFGLDGEELQALDRAVEAFADRVPYDDEPAASEHSANV